jgi:uroporphyrinogen-III decarboxylase
MDVMEFFCSADLISEEHYLRFAFPYEQRAIQAIQEEGLVASMNLMGWIEPRLPHLARLELNCLQVEAGLKGYRNDLVKCRQVLGEEICLFGNAHAVWVIEQGDEATWRETALEQAGAVGEQRRFAIGHGTPITWETSPARFRRYAEFTSSVLAEVVPLPGSG